MGNIISYNEVESKIIEIRGEKVILDKDVAQLYGVETKVVNQAMSRNPDKFPEGYTMYLSIDEWDNLRSQIVTANVNILLTTQVADTSSMSRVPPKAFTEKGLYMLATILKSPVATQTTIAIVEAFAMLRELSGVINRLPEVQDEKKKKALLRKSGEVFGDILGSEALEVIGNETTFELNLALINVKHSVKRKKRGM